MRAVFAVLGFALTLVGLAVTFALRYAPTADGHHIDDAGGWMLAAAGLGLCVVAVLGASHTGTIGQRVGGRQVP